MSAADSIPVINGLIQALPLKQRDRILDHCEPVELVFGDILCESHQPLQHAYFPITGFISLLTTLEGYKPLETGLVGNEGMFGVAVALGIAATPMRAVVQGTGIASRITASLLRHELDQSPQLQRILNRYLYISLSHLALNGACTHFHEVKPRLARWLLMTHDRAYANHFNLTQEYLAGMLGVRRSSVTVAASELQLEQLINYSRGEIKILDRFGLEAAACSCYDASIKDNARLLTGA
ncbi:Crp/Fnr family transcriptional regulator [Halomonas sp. PR-M31]|uniref:Crp/Fnr family transcriptional regulator n=1 Tax=Halomonas sp. PR-M31 TaxID=1471202 RepID=UPI000A5156D1|nr:Crp/Fnr family transcriptional regulator [Halomonas sp. PR-M31]